MPLVRRDTRVPRRNVCIRAALILLPSGALLSSALLLGIYIDGRQRLERTEVREAARIQIAGGRIARYFDEVDSDLHIIASLPLLRRFLDSARPTDRDRLAGLLLVFCAEKRRYDQVRYLDAAGQEIIRVNYNDGRPAVVPSGKLQNKSARYYFRETFRLTRGEIFASPLDLNVEWDRLEIPYKPMIRFGTPVFDSAGRKKGVVILNVLGRRLLDDFREAMHGGDPRHAMLLNRAGYWLVGDRPEDEWGFMLGKSERTFGRDFPEEWPVVSSGGSGTLVTSKGLFSYAPVCPLLSEQHAGDPAGGVGTSGRQERLASDYCWTIVSLVPQSTLSGAAFYNQTGGRILLAVVYLPLVFAAWVIAVITLSRRQEQLALREAVARARRFGEAMNIVPAYLYIKNRERQYVYGNRLVLQLFKCSAEELPGSDDTRFFPPSTVERLREVDERVLAGETTEEEIEVAPGTPEHRVYWEVKHPILDENGEIWGISGLSTDITERRTIEEELRRSAEEIEDLYNHAPCGYQSLDENGLIVRINQTQLEWLGYSREEVVGRLHFADFLTPAGEETFRETFPRFKELGYVHGLEFDLLRKDGTVLPVLMSATAVRDTDGRLIMSRSTLFDLTERKKLERELEQQARTDMLTGLNNRRYFFELAEHELARARRYDEPLSALMIDVDHFKEFNDTYGHDVGDVVLRKLSEVCVQTLRESDILGRLGGEEFAILLPETPGAHALDAAERLRATLADAEVQVPTRPVMHFTVSIGVTTRLDADTVVDDLLKRADGALYEAKRAGRDCVRVG